MRQTSSNAERLANLKVQQAQEDMKELKLEINQERERARDKTRDFD